MKLTGQIIAKDDKSFAPGALKAAAVDIPVCLGFDGAKPIGRATVQPDGSVSVELFEPLGKSVDVGSDPALGLGYRVLRSRQEGDVQVVEELEPICVGVSAELLAKITGGSNGNET